VGGGAKEMTRPVYFPGLTAAVFAVLVFGASVNSIIKVKLKNKKF
jgi:hypothetical protein